ncbi:aldehyde dehydrogenase (NADP(+)) [Roseateles oligotrophus]|uniref:Aldehyde dehydrogenase (NADP(+)) n=1 Tax=Roseateles oligotrophus TaxID=1769250 RepID=A0ABT2YHV2_9BURK|nr:aldehyde dehydrogenase (NADP(+)) [Roseateles oligotrophus]MCV2369582.1 aldehyde dehydrogenase (NADP(+)) [Roseateles oligotrophus]
MNINGYALIGGESVKGSEPGLYAFNPSLFEAIEPEFFTVGAQQIELACGLAQAAFDEYRATGDAQRAEFLEAIAAQILALGDELILRAMAESGLPRPRLEGERGRTVNQLKLFAELLREGSWQDPRFDSALPERVPPRPDLRLRMIGLGPVAVFGASNFPLAFSVAGGDTAAALAAGCPVVVKAHSAHPGTSELVGRAVQAALRQCGLPAGVFALLTGTGNSVGKALVSHPAIQAVGFTGSRAGGTALMAAAAARPQPIPVYAEMSSINPVFILPAALSARGEEIAKGFAASLVMGVGQFCTNPGLVLALEGPAFDAFAEAASAALAQVPAATMLTRGIAASYQQSEQLLAAQPQVKALRRGQSQACQGSPSLFISSGDAFLGNHALAAEIFGPASLLVACRDMAQLLQIAAGLEGQLTATLQLQVEDDGDLALAAQLLPLLERKVGRILANGFPTGVEVSTAMVHGGPFPATSDGRSSSVGTAAIARFLRPVSYQNLPQALLPEVLRDANQRALWRRRDGVLTQQ